MQTIRGIETGAFSYFRCQCKHFLVYIILFLASKLTFFLSFDAIFYFRYKKRAVRMRSQIFGAAALRFHLRNDVIALGFTPSGMGQI